MENIHIIGSKEEVFIHKDIDGTVRNFPVTEMYYVGLFFAKNFSPSIGISLRMCEITPHLISIIKKRGGAEENTKIKSLDIPCIMICWENGEHTIIDGNHRILEAQRIGRKTFPAIIFSYPIWEGFLTVTPIKIS